MPAIMTYTSLVSDTEAYLERNNPALIAQIPRFIMLAERRLAREVKILGTLTYVVNTLTIGSPLLQKPVRWNQTLSFELGTGTGSNTSVQLVPRSFEYCKDYAPNETTTGTPIYFSDFMWTHWFVAPTPDAAYPIRIGMYERPPPIDSGNQTNWWTDYAPDLLLFAVLLQAAPYLKDDERIPVWTQAYKDAAAALTVEKQAQQSSAHVT